MMNPTDDGIDDYAKDGGKELFTKMHCVRSTNPQPRSQGVLTSYADHEAE